HPKYHREGLFQDGISADNSYGKGKSPTFENCGCEGGLTYKITGRHLLDSNASHMTKAPTLRNVFPNARLSNAITNGITSEAVSSVDASYIIRTPRFKGRLSGFYSKIQDATEIGFFYTEGLGLLGEDNGNQFVAE